MTDTGGIYVCGVRGRSGWRVGVFCSSELRVDLAPDQARKLAAELNDMAAAMECSGDPVAAVPEFCAPREREPFKVPEPIALEPLDWHYRRMTEAFEHWVNTGRNPA